jgi:hypothetical protein
MLSVLQDGFKTTEAREYSQQNWQQVFNTLKEILEQSFNGIL